KVIMTANAKKYFRPTLETLENREMMDAGIGGAVMHPMMPDIAQNAQVRLLTQETSALQNQNNPLSKALENPEMLHAGIGGAMMHPMMPEFTNLARLNRFRPTLEALEGRDVPSAHLAASLMLPQAPVGDLTDVSVQQSVSHVAPSDLKDVPFDTAKV